MTDRLPPELEGMDALLKRTLPKEPMEGLTPQQLAGLREKVGAGAPRGAMKRRSKKWLFAAILAPVLAASAALFIQGNDAARMEDSYSAADEKAYEGDAAAGLEEDSPAEDVVAASEAEADETPADKPAAKPTTTVAAVKKPAAKESPRKIAQTRRQKVLAQNASRKDEAGTGSASLKGMKVGQGKPSAGVGAGGAFGGGAGKAQPSLAKTKETTAQKQAGPVGAKADAARGANVAASGKTVRSHATPPAAAESAVDAMPPPSAAPAKPSGGVGLAAPKPKIAMGESGAIATSEKKKNKSAKSKAEASPTSVASVTTTGPHPRDVVTRLVRAAEPKLRACFEAYRKRAGQGAVAKASLTFTVTPDGKVAGASAAVTDNAFRACLKNEAGRWSFPAAKQKTKVGVRLSFKS